MIDFLTDAAGTFFGLVLGTLLIVYVQRRYHAKMRKLYAEKTDFDKRIGALQAELEAARATIAIGHHTDDMAMIQEGMRLLHDLKQRFDGTDGIKVEVDIRKV